MPEIVVFPATPRDPVLLVLPRVVWPVTVAEVADTDPRVVAPATPRVPALLVLPSVVLPVTESEVAEAGPLIVTDPRWVAPTTLRVPELEELTSEASPDTPKLVRLVLPATRRLPELEELAKEAEPATVSGPVRNPDPSVMLEIVILETLPLSTFMPIMSSVIAVETIFTNITLAERFSIYAFFM